MDEDNECWDETFSHCVWSTEPSVSGLHTIFKKADGLRCSPGRGVLQWVFFAGIHLSWVFSFARVHSHTFLTKGSNRMASLTLGSEIVGQAVTTRKAGSLYTWVTHLRNISLSRQSVHPYMAHRKPNCVALIRRCLQVDVETASFAINRHNSKTSIVALFVAVKARYFTVGFDSIIKTAGVSPATFA